MTNSISQLLPKISPRIQQAIVQHVPLDPKHRATVGVILLSGHTQDLFLLPFNQHPKTLAELLPIIYHQRHQKYIHYSMSQGLLVKSLQAKKVTFQKQVPTSTSVGNKYLALARSAQSEVSEELKVEGRFQHEPHQALMEINKQFQTPESFICLIEGIGDWEPICAERPDILAALESWADLCMKTNSLIIFSAHRPSQRLYQFFKGKPCTISSQISAPTQRELKHWLLLKELHEEQLSFDPCITDELTGLLTKKARQANVGLKTLHQSIYGCLDEQWLSQQGGRAFDPQQIDLDNLKIWLDRDLIGQEEAKKVVMSAAQNLKYFGEDRKQPLWRALFTGPPGVGKTEIARGLSRFLYGHDKVLLINCTEFQQEHEVAKLLGAPPGFIGYGEPSVIETYIQRHHAGVIIFDEFEKAHRKVHQALMGMLEEGILQTPSGTIIELDRCVIIGTSNAGHREVQRRLKLDHSLSIDEIRSCYTTGVEQCFDAPLLRRFDNRVTFDFLKPEELTQVAELYLRRTSQRLTPQGLTLSWSEDFVKSLVKKSDYTLGAGELKNIVEASFKEYLIKAYHEADPKPSHLQLQVA